MDQSEGFAVGFGDGAEDDGFVGPTRASELSTNPRERKTARRRQIVEFVTPRRRVPQRQAERSQSSNAAGETQEIPEGGGVESVEHVLELPIEPTGEDVAMVEGNEEMKTLVEELQFRAKPEHLKQIRRYAQDLLKDTKSLFRCEDEIETKRALKNAWMGGIPKSTPKFGVNFESPVLKQSFFGEGGDWSYGDPEHGITITISKNITASIRDVKEAVHNFRYAFGATADHLVATKHYDEMRKVTTFEKFSK